MYMLFCHVIYVCNLVMLYRYVCFYENVLRKLFFGFPSIDVLILVFGYNFRPRFKAV